MRYADIKIIDECGSAIISVLMVIPSFVLMIASVIYIGQVSFTRARLQIAADRAALAGASHLAYALNKIAVANWEIHKAYIDLEEDFSADTQQNADAAQQRFSRYESIRNEQFEIIHKILTDASNESQLMALNLINANAPGAEAEVVVNSDFEVSDSIDPELQWGSTPFDIVTGTSFVDPDEVDGGEYRALKYLMKRRAPDASLIVYAQQDVRPQLLRGFIAEGVTAVASSSAKAYGGSIAEFAMKRTDTIHDAESMIDDDGLDHLYRSAIIPMWTAGAGGFIH